jgi:hypothetical protein
MRWTKSYLRNQLQKAHVRKKYSSATIDGAAEVARRMSPLWRSKHDLNYRYR